MVMIRRPHCLLGHLALVHVTRALVVVGEGNRRGNYRQHIELVKLFVSGVASDVFLEARN